jgi:diguanylate cyclase (GGDEF)-like protein/PAS domain S-box-containing protein
MFRRIRISSQLRTAAWWGPVGLAIAYFITARLCVILADTGKNPAALWIPSGISLAALVRFGPRLWPGVFIGSLAANFVVGLSVPSAVLLAAGNALDTSVSVWGIRRVAGPRLDFGRTRHVLAFVAYGGLIGPCLSAGFGILSLHLGGVLTSLSEDLNGWIAWALEDGLSVLVISSTLLVGIQFRRWDWRGRARCIEAGGLLGLLVVVSWLVLSGRHGEPLSEPYLVLPLMLWIALRLGAPGAVVGNLLLTFVAGFAVVNHQGPFALDTLPASMLWMQAFSAVVSLTTLLLAAALNDARAERYRQMFEGNESIQFVMDPITGRIVDANPAAAAFYGYSIGELRRMRVADLNAMPPEDSAAALSAAFAHARGSLLRRHKTSTGQTREVEVHFNLIQLDGRALLYAIVNDISALLQSEERLQLVARATRDIVWDWDLRTDRVWQSDAPDARVGVDGLAERVHPDDRDRVLTTIITAAIRGEDTWTQEYRFQQRDGAYAPVLGRGYIRYENGTPVRAVGVLLDLTERKRMEDELAHRATHDSLTGLANRSLIETTLHASLAAAARDGAAVALLIADLDHFKEINDTLGHHTGDAVLRIVGERWRAALRHEDTLGRLAGDEFAILLPAADTALAGSIAQRLVRALDEPIRIDGRELRVGTSIGLATFPDDASDVEDLVRQADRAMYVSKRGGGGFVPPAQLDSAA